jgi:hypothetical protein
VEAGEKSGAADMTKRWQLGVLAEWKHEPAERDSNMVNEFGDDD